MRTNHPHPSVVQSVCCSLLPVGWWPRRFLRNAPRRTRDGGWWCSGDWSRWWIDPQYTILSIHCGWCAFYQAQLWGGQNVGDPDYAPLAFVSFVPVKDSTENDAINPGDLLTTSSTTWHTMCCERFKNCFGTTIGEHDAGLLMSGGDFTVVGSFWGGVLPPPSPNLVYLPLGQSG